MKVRRLVLTLRFRENEHPPLDDKLEAFVGAAVGSCSDIPSLHSLEVCFAEGIQYDQFGRPLPDDLVTMPDIELLDEADIKKVDSADWYEANHPQFGDRGGILLVSAKAIDFLSESGLEDSTGVREEECFMHRVADCLKRWSRADGFYHA